MNGKQAVAECMVFCCVLLGAGPPALAAPPLFSVPEGCDDRVVVAYYADCACRVDDGELEDVEVEVGKSASRNAVAKNAPLEPPAGDFESCAGLVMPDGLVAERLHSCETIAQVQALFLGDKGDGLAEILQDALVVTRADGGKLTTEDLRSLEKAGLDEFEPVCSITFMGDTSASLTGMDWWQLVETGASDAVHHVQEKLSHESADTPPRIAVIDSGVDPIVGQGLLQEGWAFPACSKEQCWLIDEQGHGTSVAYLALEQAGSLADIVSIRVLDDKGVGSQKDLAIGILKAVELGADILNLSLAWPADVTRDDDGFPGYVAFAFAAATSAGVKSFVAAGNRCTFDPEGSCGRFQPAVAPEVLGEYPLDIVAVSGVTPWGTPSSQAVGGDEVDVWAPSEFICSRTSPGPTVEESWHRMSGTSFAVPQVSGSLALLQAWRATTELSFSDDELVKALLNSGEKNVTQPNLLDLCAAFKALGNPIPECEAWAGRAAPQDESCFETEANEGMEIKDNGLADDFVHPDLSGQGFWCEQQEIHAQPDNPPCTSCDYCRRETGDADLTLELNLRQVCVSFPHLYLRLTFEDQQYVYLDLGPGDFDGHPVRHVSVTFPEGNWPEVEEVWLMVGNENHWAGAPLLDIGVVNDSERQVTRCD